MLCFEENIDTNTVARNYAWKSCITGATYRLGQLSASPVPEDAQSSKINCTPLANKKTDMMYMYMYMSTIYDDDDHNNNNNNNNNDNYRQMVRTRDYRQMVRTRTRDRDTQ